VEQVVQRVLIWYFKASDKPKVIYLAEQGLQKSWLPSIKNIEFRLLTSEEIKQRKTSVYLFTEVEKHSPNTHNIVFTFGDAECKFAGDTWHFRISKPRMRLWRKGSIFGDCSLPSINAEPQSNNGMHPTTISGTFIENWPLITARRGG